MDPHRLIETTENEEGHDRSIVLGDFNMDPWSDGLVSAVKFHAINDRREVLLRSQRSVNHKPRKYFFNPMWNVLGSETPGPPGTLRYLQGVFTPGWRVFDQVLVRSALVHRLPPTPVSILTKARCLVEKRWMNCSLLDRNGSPSPSDHLPVLLKLHPAVR